jgi:hypothetical protein
MKDDKTFQENVVNAMAEDYEKLRVEFEDATPTNNVRRTFIHIIAGIALALIVVALATIGITY